MSVTFANAPLVELVAELRWGPGIPPPVGQASFVQTEIIDAGKLDQFFISLGGELYQHGFQRAERLIPAGFPILPFQPVFRYRNPAETDLTVIFQAGMGYFGAIALPRYRSWHEFEPLVERGVKALLKARNQSEQGMKFASAALRYINLFGSGLTNGEPALVFARRVFGLSIGLPDAFSASIANEGRTDLNLQLQMRLNDGSVMSLLVGDGQANNQSGIILDMTIANNRSLEADAAQLMANFTTARNTLHDTFVALTKPIESLLKPTGI